MVGCACVRHVNSSVYSLRNQVELVNCLVVLVVARSTGIDLVVVKACVVRTVWWEWSKRGCHYLGLV